MTGEEKLSALQNAETQYDEMLAYLESLTHGERYYTKAECSKYFSASNDGAGSGLVAERLDGYTYDDIINAGIPSGAIAIWSGSEAGIPAGWNLCNGMNGTPDLRGLFVVGAGGSYAKGAIGGASTVTVSSTVTVAGHALTASETPLHTHSGITDRYSTYAHAFHWQGSSNDSDEPPLTSRTAHTEYTGDGDEHGHAGSYYSATVGQSKLPPYYALCYIQKA